jgi:hypothetical protein
LEIILLYGYRFRIELGFRQAIHVLGAYAYHFWMSTMKPLRRWYGDQYLHRKTDAYRAAIKRKIIAFHLHVQLGCIAQGLLQHLSLNHSAEVSLALLPHLAPHNENGAITFRTGYCIHAPFQPAGICLFFQHRPESNEHTQDLQKPKDPIRYRRFGRMIEPQN